MTWNNSPHFGASFIHHKPVNNKSIQPYLNKYSLSFKFIISPKFPYLIQTIFYSNLTSFVILYFELNIFPYQPNSSYRCDYNYKLISILYYYQIFSSTPPYTLVPKYSQIQWNFSKLQRDHYFLTLNPLHPLLPSSHTSYFIQTCLRITRTTRYITSNLSFLFLCKCYLNTLARMN